MTQVKIAVIGGGIIGKSHIQIASKRVDCELTAVCDSDPAVEDLAFEYDAKYYTDYHDMLAQETLDGVIIATPNDLHCSMARDCAAKSLHMLVEKPLTTTLEQGRQLLAAAQKYNVQVLVGHYRRFNPIVAKVREVIQSGQLGQISAVSALWALKKPDPYFGAAWRTQAGGGPVLINLIHDIDNLRYFFGEVSSVYAQTATDLRNFAVEDSAAITLRFASGVLGNITVSDATPSPWSYESTMFENPAFSHHRQNCYFIMGSKASLAFPSLELWSYPHDHQDGWNYPLQKTTLEVERSDPLTSQLAHFCQVIRGETTPLISGADGFNTLATTLAVHESSQADRPVTPDLLPL